MELNEPFVDDDDVDGLDLTPRDAPDSGGGNATKTRKVGIGVVISLLLVGLGVVAWKGLSDASLYFRTADEAVAQRDELGDRRFRIEGSVVDGSIETDGNVVTFLIEANGVEAEIRHLGDPPDLFQPGIPVVLEGRWNAEEVWFDSDRMLVRHTETYIEDNRDRVDDYVDDEDRPVADDESADVDDPPGGR